MGEQTLTKSGPKGWDWGIDPLKVFKGAKTFYFKMFASCSRGLNVLTWSVQIVVSYSCNRLSRLMLLKLGRSYGTDSYPMSVVYLFCLFVSYSGELIVLPPPMLIYLGIWELLSVRISKYWQLAKQHSVYFPRYVLAYSHTHLYSHFVQTHFLSLRTSHCFNSHFLKK